MLIHLIHCPNCGAELTMADYSFNRTIYCKYCGSPLRAVENKESPEYWVNSRVSVSLVQSLLLKMCAHSKTPRGLENNITMVRNSLYYVPFYNICSGVVQIRNNKPVLGYYSVHIPANRFNPASPVSDTHFSLSWNFKKNDCSIHPPEDGTTIIPSEKAPAPGDYADAKILHPKDSVYSSSFAARINTVFYPVHIVEYDYSGESHILIVDGFNGEILKFTAPITPSHPAYLTAFTAAGTGLIFGFLSKLIVSIFTGTQRGMYKSAILILLFLLPAFIYVLKRLPHFLAAYLADYRSAVFDGKEFKESE